MNHVPLARLAAAFAAVWMSVGWSGPPLARPVAAAAGSPVVEHRAALIIDTGTEVKTVCVRFQEESLTGVELLARGKADPVFQGFAGKGAAVCALCGVGCPAGESCLTCDAEGKFWSYSRAPAGTASLRNSSVGASGTTVRDGDVEGWKWGLGGTAPFATVEQVCGEAPAPTSTTAGAPVVTIAPGQPTPSAPAAPPTSATATSRARAAGTTTTGVAAASTSVPTGPDAGDRTAVAETVAEPGGTGTTVASGLSATRTSGDGDGGGTRWPGLVLFAAMVGGLVAWATVARRRRRRMGGPLR